MGPWQPYYGPRVATPRNLTSFDLPTDRPRSSATIYFPRTISRAVSRVGYVSDYISPSGVWSNQGALLAMLNEYNTIVIDRTLYFTSEITLPAGKRIEFTSSGRYGPTKILQFNPAASIFTLSSDVDIRGLMVVEYVFRSNAATKALKGAASRVRIEALEAKGVDYAINLSGALADVWIGSVGVDNIGTDVPLYIGASPGTTGQESVRCQRVRNQPNVTTVTNANKTYTPHLDGRVLVYSGAMTANRSVTIASNTCIGSGEFRVSHQASGGFTVDVAGLKTLSNGQTAHVGFTGDGIATLLG
ncbi:hypothetical protein [Methylocella sp.]|uniref:hypothetical protein n=1 Tax=Methylocella sp. TaxID=1978226 RepID=UPI0035AE50CF